MSIEREKQVLRFLEKDMEFRKNYPNLWFAILESLPHSYTILYNFNSIQEAKNILNLELQNKEKVNEL